MTRPTLPVEPLERWARANLHPASRHVADQEGRMGHLAASTIATAVGVKPHTLSGWRRRKSIPLHAADRAAIHLGLHPTAIWPDWYEK